MRKRSVYIVGIASGLLSSASADARTRGSSSLDQAAHEYDVAQVRGDRDLLIKLLADDYVLVNSTGETETKQQFIAELTDPAYRLHPFTVRHAIDRRWSKGAVLGGVARLTGDAAGKPFDVCLRFADFWALGSKGWQVIYTQAAHAKPEECG